MASEPVVILVHGLIIDKANNAPIDPTLHLPEAPVGSTVTFTNCMLSMVDFLMSGVLPRYPNLKLTYAEGQLGWIPYILERADKVWEHNRGWADTSDTVPEPPSTYYYRNIYGCFFRDPAGMATIDAIGVDRITFETDYPHTDSTWPHTKAVAQTLVDGLTEEQIYKVMRGNAIRMLSLDIT